MPGGQCSTSRIQWQHVHMQHVSHVSAGAAPSPSKSGLGRAADVAAAAGEKSHSSSSASSVTSSGAPETELELDVAEGTAGNDGDQLPLYLRRAETGAGERPLCGSKLARPAQLPPHLKLAPCGRWAASLCQGGPQCGSSCLCICCCAQVLLPAPVAEMAACVDFWQPCTGLMSH